MSDSAAVIAGSIEINVIEGRVVLAVRQQGKDAVFTAFDPGQALEVADMLAKTGYYAKYGKDRPITATLGDMVLEKKREKLNNRCQIMLKSMLKDRRSNQHIITQLVDTCMAELT